MLASVFTKTVRDRWRGMAIAVVALGLGLLLAMYVYRDFAGDVFNKLPEAFRSLMNIPENADAASLAVAVFYGMYGALTLAGMAIAMGAASIAGEERDGTLGLLLGNPKSRSNVLGGKIANMVALVTAATIVLWALAYLVAGLLGVSLGGLHVAAYSVHLWINALFYGMLACALGAWTGNRGVAIGIPTGLMILGLILTGVFPLIKGWENVSKVLPWYYFNGAEPASNGFSLGHFAVLAVAVLVLGVAAYIGLNRRDLKGQTVGTSLIDRLREHPMTRKIADRIAGSIRVSRIWVKTFSEHQGLFIVVAYIMFLMSLLMGPLYKLMDQVLLQYTEQLPKAMWAFVGSTAQGMSTPQDFYEGEIFGLMAWMAVMVMTVTIGARALAGEESDRTMGLLLANPIRRSTVVIEKTYTMTVFAVIVGVATWAGVWFGSLLGGLGISAFDIAAATVLAVLVGLVFGAVALLLSAATGRVKVAVYGTIGITLAMFLVNSIAILNHTVDVLAAFTPFGHYLTNSPLSNGMDWSNAALLAIAFVVLVALSVYAFDRRDLRQTG
jgi:ABC-2 type transport system permease protein